MKTVIAFTRSVLFYLVYAVVMVIFGTITCTIGILMPYKMRQNVVTWANAIIIKWLNVSCGIKLKVDGLENTDHTLIAFFDHFLIVITGNDDGYFLAVSHFASFQTITFIIHRRRPNICR